MKKQITFLIVALFLSGSVIAQNCGIVTNFTVNTSPSETAGNTVYTFSITVSATSGGDKSTVVNIYSNDVPYTFVNAVCYSSGPSGTPATVYVLDNGGAGWDVPTCTPLLDYFGKTNSVCGGTTCSQAIGVSESTLPVELISFSVSGLNSDRRLMWSTASELENQGFEVERSFGGDHWEVIGWVEGAGTTLEVQNYSFIDDQVFSGQLYYRLRQVDYDGSYEYSSVVVFEAIEQQRAMVFPNPTTGSLNIDKAYSTLLVSNMQGVLIKEFQADKAPLDISDLKNGVYILTIITDTGERENVKILKQ